MSENNLSDEAIGFIKECYVKLNQSGNGVWAFADLSQSFWLPKLQSKNKQVFFNIIHDAIAYGLIGLSHLEDFADLNNDFLNFYNGFISQINKSQGYSEFLEKRVEELENRFGLVWKEQEEQFLKVISEQEIVLGTGLFLLDEDYLFDSETKDKKNKIIKDKSGKKFTLTRKRGDSFLYYCKEISCLFLLYSVQSQVNVYRFKENHYLEYYPILKEKGDDFGFGEVRDNLLIEGDNYYALQLLQFTHKGKIDVIYIDPPYNTGNGDFKYNDAFVGSDDGSRHSKWLSFMKKRLLLAKNLLSKKGVIFISIDEFEFSNLKCLCNSIWGENNSLVDLIRKTKSSTNDSKTGVNLQHEYCLVYTNKKENVSLLGGLKDTSGYKNPDNDINGPWVSSDPTSKGGSKANPFVIKNPFTGKVDVPPKGRYWCFSFENFQNHIKSGRIVFKKEHKENERGFIYKSYLNKLKTKRKTLDSLFFTDNSFMNQVATKEIINIFPNNSFHYPKGVSFIQNILLHSTDNCSVILDFFAGSGTTGQAVLELNKEDGGNRKYILCTNNENNICEDVTYERMKRISSPKEYGIDMEPLEHGLKYLQVKHQSKLDFEVADELGNFESIKAINDVKFGATKVISDNKTEYITDKYAVFKGMTSRTSKKVVVEFIQNAIRNNIFNLVCLCNGNRSYDKFKDWVDDYFQENIQFNRFDYNLHHMSQDYINQMFTVISGEEVIDIENHISFKDDCEGEE